MQPFSYQVTDTTCWITSMLNGIIFVLNANDHKPKTISPLAYSELHSLLRDDGVHYDTLRKWQNVKSITRAVGQLEGVEILFYCDDEVAGQIRNLSFQNNQKMAAICDIHNGEHSILITNRKKEWLHCFDPWWEYVAKKKCTGNYKPIPAGRLVNLEIRETHLLSKGKKKDFRMGGQSRHLTLIRPN